VIFTSSFDSTQSQLRAKDKPLYTSLQDSQNMMFVGGMGGAVVVAVYVYVWVCVVREREREEKEKQKRKKKNFKKQTTSWGRNRVLRTKTNR
jgi:Na+/melibiose symporter-like transporter